jgi:hypothetical protein
LLEVRGLTPTGADLGSRIRVDLLNESQLQYLQDMFRALEYYNLRRYVTYIDMSNIANITFDYTYRYRVILDSPDNIAQNIAILRSTIERAELEGRIQPGVRGTIRVSDSRGEFNFSEDR